jgi:hypothetical protein
MYDPNSGSVVFSRIFERNTKSRLKKILVYKKNSDTNFGLVYQHSCSNELKGRVFRRLYDMNMIIFELVEGKRGRDSIIYKVFTILTGQLRQIRIPRRHPCGRLEYHDEPIVFKDKIIISCNKEDGEDETGGRTTVSLFNITWRHGVGTLSEESR